ncbi:MAG: hypothetical protein EBT86_08440 [Actinobacteria bacterium]|nr:hypothetical protein [Actinomycetota bacterium]
MSIDKAAKNFEKLVDNVKTDIPVMLKEGSIGYGNYILKRNKNDQWDLYMVGKRYKTKIDTFNLKISALMCAKEHKANRVMEMVKFKNLDQRYWASHIDSIIFDKRYKEAKDKFQRELFLWRYEVSKSRAELYKQKIIEAYSFIFR